MNPISRRNLNKFDYNYLESTIMNDTTKVKQNLEDLFFSGGPFTFLIGSGISFSPPSNMIPGYTFTKEILNRLSPDENTKKELIKLSDPERIDKLNKGDFIRFEGFMQEIQSDYDRNLDVLNCLADCKNPNKNHYILACLIEKGNYVFTTNFDMLIEIAFMDLFEKDFCPLISNIEFENYLSNPRKYPNPLFKLHGSLKRYKNNKWNNSTESLIATFEAVGKSGENLIFEPGKLEVFRSRLKKNNLVVMGYSGFDDFDIGALLKVTKSDEKIIWVNHSSSVKMYSWNELRDLPDEKKDINGNYRRKEHEYLFEMGFNSVRRKENIHLFDMDTSEVMDMLIKENDIAIDYSKLRGNHIFDVKEYFDNWERKYFSDVEDKHLFCGNQFLKLDRYISACANYKSIIELSKNSNEEEILGIKSTALNNLGIIYEKQGELELALKCYFDALEIDRKYSNKKAEADTLDNLGGVYLTLGSSNEAIICFETALAIDSEIGYEKGMAGVFGNLGNIYYRRKDYKKAIKYHENALEIHLKIGDRKGEADDASNIGSIYFRKGKIKKALEFYTIAFKIHVEIGSLEGEAGDLSNIGNINYRAYALEEAMNCYTKAKEIFYTIGNKKGFAVVLTSMGNVYSDLKNLEEALKCYERAKEVNSEIGYRQGEANALTNIGLTYRDIRDFENAFLYLNKSLEIYKKYNLIHGKKLVTKAIGKIRKYINRKKLS